MLAESCGATRKDLVLPRTRRPTGLSTRPVGPDHGLRRLELMSAQ
jgi:hypothetical protein